MITTATALFVLMQFFSSGQAAADLSVTPPENQWAMLGKESTLLCKSSEPLQTCTWIAPSTTRYTLKKGQQAESGRIRQFGEVDVDCGLRIERVEEKDAGKWTCSVDAYLGGNVVSVDGKADLGLATMPGTVSLSTFDDAAIEKQMTFVCLIPNATPEPVVEWYVGQEELTGYKTEGKMDGMDFKQTLIYSPKTAHANQTLRCVVDHVGLENKREASHVLKFTQEVAEAAEQAVAEDEAALDPVPYIVACCTFMVAVGIISFLIFAIRSRRLNAAAAASKSDEEAPVFVEEDDKKSTSSKGEEEEKKDEEKTTEESKEKKEEGASKTKIAERMAYFFRMNKTNKDKEGEEENKDEDKELVEVKIDGEVVDGDTKEVEVEEETKEAGVDETKEEETATVGFGSRLWTYFKSKRPENKKAAPATDEEVAMEQQNEESEKLKQDGEEKEKAVEYEPEEKEEMNKSKEAEEIKKGQEGEGKQE
jgi:hypothetical protein